ncbi:unnamed protein product [Camellia sinensis]
MIVIVRSISVSSNFDDIAKQIIVNEMTLLYDKVGYISIFPNSNLGTTVYNIVSLYNLQNPSQPDGVNEFKVSHQQNVSVSLQVMNLSVPSNKQKEGVDEIQISHPPKRSKSPLQEMNSPVPSFTQTELDKIQVSHSGKIIKPFQEINSSVSSSAHEEKLWQEEIYGEYGVSKMNVKDEVVHAYICKCFCYDILKEATNKFSKKNLLGEGGFGDVYKGWIDYCTMGAAKPGAGTPIAVKRLRKEGAQGCEEWLNELTFLGKLSHPNVVKLTGHCCEGNHRILVYEFMTKGSLEAHLSREKMQPALQFGHPIFCSTVGSMPSFLTLDWLSLVPRVTRPTYPPGHWAHRVTLLPSTLEQGHLTFKTDVYSFGVVLLEIVSGLSAAKIHSNGVAKDLAKWARSYLSNMQEVINRVIGKRLGNDFQMEEAYEFAEIILCCLALSPKSRPTMTEVVHALEQLEKKVKNKNKNKLQYQKNINQHINRAI